MSWRTWFMAAGVTAVLGGGAWAAPDLSDGAFAAAFGPKARVVRDTLSGAPRALFGLSAKTHGATAEERAGSFIEASRRLLALGTTSLHAVETHDLPEGQVVRFEQRALGLPVEGRSLAVKLDAAGRVRSVTSDLLAFDLQRPPVEISAEAARDAVKSQFEVAAIGTPREVVLVSAPGLARVAWRVPVALIPLAAHFFVWIDAETGAVLKQMPAGLDQPIQHLPRKSEAPR